MRTILTTTGMPAKQAFDLDVANARIFQQEITPPDRHNFYAELKASSLADLSILESEVAPTTWTSKRGDRLLPTLPYGDSGAEREIADRCVTVNDSVLSFFDTREVCAEVMPQSLSK